MQSVSLVIPNWNGEDLLQACLPPVIDEQSRYRGQSELIVVDDASTDGSVHLLQDRFPAVRTIIHPHNLGFGRACWSGALAARNALIIFLNSDVKVQTPFIEPLTACFEDGDIFAASPLIFNQDGTISDVSISIPYFRRGKIRYKKFPVEQLLARSDVSSHPWYTLFPIGAAFAVDRARFIALQGFDDLFYPFYYEDTDLGFRAWRRGWKCVVAPRARVIHYHQGAIARSFKRFRVRALRKRNRLYFLWKNLTTGALLRQHLLFQLMRLCYRPFCLDAMIHVATVLALPGFLKAMHRRRREKQAAVYCEEEIFKIIAAAANRRLMESSRGAAGAAPGHSQICRGPGMGSG